MLPFIQYYNNSELSSIIDKILHRKRIDTEEAFFLYNNADLGLLGCLANGIKEIFNDKNVYFNKNLHIETTNYCIYNCKFCSYYAKSNNDGWRLSKPEIISKIQKAIENGITEVHITGGVQKDYDLKFYLNLIAEIKTRFTELHIKALTATEIFFLAELEKISIYETLIQLKNAGLGSIPGGGAEIFDEKIRQEICPNKISGKTWLTVHEIAHNIGLYSNATMLYGHIESLSARLNHLNELRILQDKTKGFNCFIPLKFKNSNNQLDLGETTQVDDLKTYAISRIFLDNFNHIKAYWPMTGKNLAQLSLSFGVDDLDGTIYNSTKIYSKAGAEEANPTMTKEEICFLIKKTNKIPIERNSFYQTTNQ